MRLKWVQSGRPRKANSYRIGIVAGHVQQGNEPVMAEAKKMSSPMRL